MLKLIGVIDNKHTHCILMLPLSTSMLLGTEQVQSEIDLLKPRVVGPQETQSEVSA